MTPTTRTLSLLRREMWLPWVVESWTPYTNRRSDLFGCFDILCVGVDGTLAVQVTTTGNMGSRVKKVCDSPYAKACSRAGWEIEVHGWKKYAKKVDGVFWRVSRTIIGLQNGKLVPILVKHAQRQ